MTRSLTMPALACTSLAFLLCAAEVFRRPAGSLAAGLLLALSLASTVGIIADLAGRLGKMSRWMWPLVCALPALLVLPSLSEVVHRAAERQPAIAQIAPWALAVPVALLAVFLFWRAPVAKPWSPLIRASLCLGLFVGLLLLMLTLFLPYALFLFPFAILVYVLVGLVSFALGFRQLSLIAATLGCSVLAIVGPARYVELIACFSWTALLCLASRLHSAQDKPEAQPRESSAASIRRLFLVAAASFVVAHLVVRALPGSYAAARGGGPLSGLIHSFQSASDFDRDGEGAVLAHADCAPFDSRIGAHRHEILGNGIDENCRLGDGDAELEVWIAEQDAVNPTPPRITGDIVLVVVDTLRYDVAHSEYMPTLRRWAKEGVSFSRAYTTSTFTQIALPGILAAQHPASVELTFHSRLSARPSRPIGGLAPWLRENGYDTAVVGMYPDSTMDVDNPYAAGFRVARYSRDDDNALSMSKLAVEAWKDLDSSGPRFLLLHHMQVHRQTVDFQKYKGNAREVDKSLAWLRDQIGGNASWIIVADHGEEFSEHGGHYHAATLYDEVTHVPLIFHGPFWGPMKVDALSSTRAIMPTLVASLGGASERERDLYLCLRGENCRDMVAPMALELQDRHVHALVLGDKKIIRDLDRHHLEAFDLRADPNEKHPLSSIPSDLLAIFERWEEASMGPRSSRATWPYSP